MNNFLLNVPILRTFTTLLAPLGLKLIRKLFAILFKNTVCHFNDSKREDSLNKIHLGLKVLTPTCALSRREQKQNKVLLFLLRV